MPNDSHHGLPPPVVRAANEKIDEVLEGGHLSSSPSTSSTGASKKRRGPYGIYSGELRAKIGRFAAQNSVAAARRKFSAELEKDVNESSIRGMKDAYIKALKTSDSPTELPKGTRGRPLHLGREWDDKAKSFINAVQKSGGSVSTKLVLAGTKGLLQGAKPPILAEHGGTLTLDKTWARSLLDRMGYTKRKGTKGVKNRPDDMDEITGRFHRRIGRRVRKFDIPDSLIINWDQTAVEVIPATSWTMHPKGDKQVPIKGSDDKRQYTSLLACTLSGHFLPPQVIYQGKTEQCHAHVVFPPDWDIWHTESHWSNSSSMIRYVDKIIVPYVSQTKETMDVPADTKPLLIFDVFRAHHTKEFLDHLNELGFLYVFVPGACTDILQPLDATVNNVYKKEMQGLFANWYASRVAEGIEEGGTFGDVVRSINLRTSAIKPVHATWMMRVHEIMCHDPDLIVKGFQGTGILKAVGDARLQPVPALEDSDAEEGYWEE